MRLHDNDRIRARVCEKHVGDEAVGLLLVQLLEVGHPSLLLGHLCTAPFPDCNDYATRRSRIHRSAWKMHSRKFSGTVRSWFEMPFPLLAILLVLLVVVVLFVVYLVVRRWL
jgi:hypothetical protein